MSSWSLRICEICLKNAHKEVKMVRRRIGSSDENAYWEEEVWVCPECGSCKKY